MKRAELLGKIEQKDCITSNHCRKTAYYAMKLGYNMRLNEKEMTALELSAALHDIGKINVPDAILLKPNVLTEDEYEIVKRHSIWGAEILERVFSEQDMDMKLQKEFERERICVTKTIRHHHERFDGKGYPDGLKGDKIPVYSQIIAVADAYDAMTSNRPYRQAMETKNAVDVLRSERGKQFRPQMIDLFINSVIPSSFRNASFAK
ncbi:MAG: hypothetical protein APF84_14550 [Gracilibacter sp. BRH_c7a]|nr:MAG: hypothetical protein APF84_14550 [Gracilibacter sp. BRH_c7a]